MNETYQIGVREQILDSLVIWIYLGVIVLGGVFLLAEKLRRLLHREPESRWSIDDLKVFIIWLLLMSVGSDSIANVVLHLYQPTQRTTQVVIEKQINENRRRRDAYNLFIMIAGGKTFVKVPSRVYDRLPLGSCIQIDYRSYAINLIIDSPSIAPVQVTRLAPGACAKSP